MVPTRACGVQGLTCHVLLLLLLLLVLLATVCQYPDSCSADGDCCKGSCCGGTVRQASSAVAMPWLAAVALNLLASVAAQNAVRQMPHAIVTTTVVRLHASPAQGLAVQTAAAATAFAVQSASFQPAVRQANNAVQTGAAAHGRKPAVPVVEAAAHSPSERVPVLWDAELFAYILIVV